MTISKVPATMADLVREHQALVVDMDDFSEISMIGRGGAAEVFKSYDSKLKVECAVKRLYKEDLSDKSLAHLIREIHTMALINNRFCMPMLGFSAVPPYCLVLEYLQNGSLDEAIFRANRKQMSETHMCIIALCIANGMAHIHAHGVYHRDLKPGNVLLDEKEIPRICDFGLARIENGTKCSKGIGTPNYMAPEQIESTQYTHKVDVYAYGVMLYEMVERQRAFTGYTVKSELINAITRGERPQFTRKTHKTMQHLITRCWDQDPNNRPEFTEIFDQIADGKAKWKDADRKKVEKVVNQIRENDKKPEVPREVSSKVRVNIQRLLDTLEPKKPKEPEPAPKVLKLQDPSSDEDLDLAPKVNVGGEVTRKDIDYVQRQEQRPPDNSVGVNPPNSTMINPHFGRPQPFPQAQGFPPAQGNIPMPAMAQSSTPHGYRGAPPRNPMSVVQQRQQSAFAQIMTGPQASYQPPPMPMMQNQPTNFGPRPNKTRAGSHPLPEVNYDGDIPLPSNIPPPPSITPAFLPPPEIREFSPAPFPQPSRNLPVDSSILSNPSLPQFLQCVESLLTKIQDQHLATLAPFIAFYMAKNTSPLVQYAVLLATVRLCIKFGPKFIEPLISASAFNGMPFADQRCEVLAADLLSIVFQRARKLVTANFWPQILYLAKKKPLDAAVLIRILINDPESIQSTVMQYILPTTSLFKDTPAATRAIGIISFMLKNVQSFEMNYGDAALRQLVAFSETKSVETAKAAYNALAQHFKPKIQLDFYMMLWHMNIPSLVNPILSIFIRHPDLPASTDITQNLIAAARTSQLASLVLLKYADTSINQANVFLYDQSWCNASLPTIIDTLKVLLILFKYPPMRPYVANRESFPILMRNLIASKIPFILVVLVSVIRRCSLTPDLLLKLSNAGVFSDWYQVGIAMQDNYVLQNLMVLTDTLIRIAYIPDLKYIVAPEIDIVRTKTPSNLVEFALMNLVAVSQSEECAKIMIQNKFQNVLEKETHQLAGSILNNLKKFM